MNKVEFKIAVVILNWNGKKDTLECLSSLAQVKYFNYETIVVDNGSTDDSVSAIQEQFPNVTLLLSKENLGFAGGNNIGIRHALQQGAEGILLLNNDTIVDPSLLTAFATAAKKEPSVGILGAKLYSYADKGRFDHFGGMWNAARANFDLVGKDLLEKDSSFEKATPIDYVCGAALFAKREVFNAIGMLEPRFFLLWEESDFCFRARKAGFSTQLCPAAKVWHKGSASVVGGKPHSSYFWWRNRLLWIERNCRNKERLSITFKTLLPEVFQLYKRHLIKYLQLIFLRIFRPKEDLRKRKGYLLRNRAAIKGVHDYLFRSFGNGPPWIYKPDVL